MDPESLEPRWRGEAHAWITLAASFALALQAVLYVLTLTLVALPGWTAVAIESGSMAPVLSVGDVVIVKRVAHPMEGAAVLIRQDGEAALFHRIVSWNADGTATTKGDANAAVDSTPVREDQIVGIGRVALPAIGLPVVWLASGDSLHLGLALVCELLIIMSARSMRSSTPAGLGTAVPLSAFHLRQLRSQNP